MAKSSASIKGHHRFGQIYHPRETHLSKSTEQQNLESKEIALSRGPRTSQNVTREAEKSLYWILQSLGSFVHDFGFDERKFKMLAKFLKNEIAESGVWVEDIISFNPKLLAQLRFAQHMYSMIENATEFLQFYTNSTMDRRLVRNIIQLNVRLLGLHDFSGIPDPSIEGYADTLSIFASLLEYWGEMFNRLKKVPLSVRLMFETQFIDANNVIQLLESRLPWDEEPRVLP
ncbi:hypothetical protein JCM33374_g5366 [Metschnikowia sp. JCM 33374]|nr:hypothetical protein JCM33374_g5366 [Metschnikowia sp. JCM 33374]